MTSDTPRHAWLDYARLLSLVLIVLLHAQPRMLCVAVGILATFFGSSGCLFDSSRYATFGAYLRHRVRSMAVPYFAFYAICYALWLAVGRRWDAGVDATVPLWQWLMGLPKAYPLVVVAPFWFLTCMLSMQLIYYWIDRTRRVWRLMPIVLSVMLSAVAALCPGTEHLNFWNINYAMLYMPFFAVGHCLRPCIADGVRIMWWHGLLMAAVAVTLLTRVAPQVASPDWRSLVLIAGGMASIVPVAAVATWLSRQMGRNRVVELMATCGVVCLALQNYCIGALRVVVIHVWPGIDVMGWPVSVAIAVITLVAVGVASLVISRYAPWLIGRRSGKKW